MSKSKLSEKISDFLSRSAAKELLKNHKLNEVGYWKVLGEDPNCDMGGHHHQPQLGIFEGRLEDIIAYAVEMDGFWQWGSGGNIVLYQQPEIIKVGKQSYKQITLLKEISDLQEKLEAAKRNLDAENEQ